MDNKVKLPIKTIKNGEKTTKICVEDSYKMVGRIKDSLSKLKTNSFEILDTGFFREQEKYKGYFVVGTGVSQPCNGDEYDEEIGSNIAFMKAKLNANLKKFNLIRRVANEYKKAFSQLDEEAIKVLKYIYKDIEGIRQYNPEYFTKYFPTDEVQEQTKEA